MKKQLEQSPVMEETGRTPEEEAERREALEECIDACVRLSEKKAFPHISARQELMETICLMGGDRWAYKRYTDLAYLLVTGKSAASLRQERKVCPEAPVLSSLSYLERELVNRRENEISLLLWMGLDYERIKTLLQLREKGRR